MLIHFLSCFRGYKMRIIRNNGTTAPFVVRKVERNKDGQIVSFCGVNDDSGMFYECVVLENRTMLVQVEGIIYPGEITKEGLNYIETEYPANLMRVCERWENRQKGRVIDCNLK